jgi:hypothetical protein
MRRRASLSVVIVLSFYFAACGGVAGQHKAINSARLGVEATAIAADSADLTIRSETNPQATTSRIARVRSRASSSRKFGSRLTARST